MATIDTTKAANGTQLWETLTAADVGAALVLPKGGAQLAVQVTGTFGGILTMEGTVDGTNWATLKNSPGGTDVTFSATGIADISTAVYAIRPSAGAGISDVDVYVNVVA